MTWNNINQIDREKQGFCVKEPFVYITFESTCPKKHSKSPTNHFLLQLKQVWVKSKLCSFCKPSTWWKTTQRPLLTKLEDFESSEALKSLKKQTFLILYAVSLVKNYPKISFDKSGDFLKLWMFKSLKKQTLLIL